MFMTSPTNFYYVTQIILLVWSCNQSLLTVHFYYRSYHNVVLEICLDYKFH